MTIGQGRDSNSDGTASPQSSPRPQRVKVRDPRWLQVQVCQDFIAHKCPRTEGECAYAHPPANCIVEAGKVTACFDAMKGRCQRDKCKYFHPPKHISEHLESLGKAYQQQRVASYHRDHVFPHSHMPFTEGPLQSLPLGHWMPRWHSSEKLPSEPPSPRSPNLPRRLDKSDKLEVCSDFMNNTCPHEECICPFAHPPPMIPPGVDGYITVCMDYMKGECQRISCRYFHPPPHLQARVKAAQRRPSQVYGPIYQGSISPVMGPQMICSSPMSMPGQQIQVPVPVAGPSGMPSLIPVPPEMYFPVSQERQPMMPVHLPPLQAFIWPTGEPVCCQCHLHRTGTGIFPDSSLANMSRL
ncbi:muscleblind-like protein 2a [Rhopilema esculentum]|uniref:muscleblind-like protein 2a n=1 Tax=Rhopilema esculentum TaxID=499914 RepID=UPI0031CF725C